MPLNWKHLSLFIRLSRPLYLLGGILLYSLGAAIADYLGRPIDVTTFLLGQFFIIFIQLMAQYLNEYANSEVESNVTTPFRLPLTGSGVLGSNGLPRRVALYAASFSLAISASLVLLMMVNVDVPLLSWVILTLIFMAAFLYNLRPFNLSHSGYGEITASFVIAGLVPAFSFTLHTGEIHRFLIMSSTPLICLFFALMITFELPNFALDTKLEKRNLLIRINWPTAMRLHDIVILIAVVSIIIAFFLGLPHRVALGTIIALPLAAAQLWQMDRIRQGYPVRWRTFLYSGIALFVLTAYLEFIGYLLS
jgi:1,4-dihydroxy-2-naphthoate octaprenyltransferase